MALLRSGGPNRRCPIIEVHRKQRAERQTDAIDPFRKSCCRRATLLYRRKILIGQRRLNWTLDADKRLVGCRMASVAAAGKLVESDRKSVVALCANRFFKLRDPRIDDGLHHFGDRNAVKGGMQPSGLLQAFLDLVDLITRKVPVTFPTGKPQLGVAKLRGCHEFAKSWLVAFFCWLCGCKHYRNSKGNRC